MFGCGAAAPAQGNDGRAQPGRIACTDQIASLALGTSVFARTRSGESRAASSCVRRASPECSYAFEVTARSDLRATLFSQNFDGALSLYALEPAKELACADDSPLGDTHRARIDVPLEPGGYVLHVESSNEQAGDFELFAELESLPALAQVCAAAEPLREGAFQRGSTRGAASVFESSCDGRGVGPDHLYAFALEGPRRVRVREQSEFDALLSLHADCAGGELACSDDAPNGHASLSAELAAGSYYLVVDSSLRGEGGDYVLAMEQAEPPATLDHAERCMKVGTLAEDALQEIDTFREPATTAASCGGSDAPESLFMFVLREPRRVSVFASEFEFDPVFSLRRACEYSESEVLCVRLPRRAGPQLESSEQLVLEIDLPAGDYMLGVDGVTRGQMGAGTIRLRTRKSAP
jgi:hypothetical protein